MRPVFHLPLQPRRVANLTAVAAVIVALLLAACTPVTRVPAASPRTARPCDLYLPRGEVEGETLTCGYVTVPWDRTDPASAKAQLAYIILKATGATPQPDPIVHVSGGPGAGSTLREPVLEFIQRYAPLRVDHDIILYDQRGMGHSEPFFACGYLGEAGAKALAPALEQRLGQPPTAAELQAAACEQEWSDKGYPASGLSTQASAADLVDLMAALDYPAYNLYGVSYGTRLLMALMHFFPNESRVRSVVLDSPFPLPEDQVNDLTGSVTLEYPALRDGLFAACAQDERCNGAYPDLSARYAALVARLAAAPMQLSDGSELTAEAFQRSVFPFNAAIGFVPYMPRLIAELAAGDFTTWQALARGAIPSSHHLTALGVEHPRAGELVDAYLACTTATPDDSARQAYEQRLLDLWDAEPAGVVAFLADTCLDGSGAAAGALVQELPAGAFNSIIVRFAPEQTTGVNLILNSKLRCTEQAPFAANPAALREQLAAKGLPAVFAQEVAAQAAASQAGCRGWSRALTAPTPSIYGAYPVLILSGDFDALTPPAFGRLAATQLPQATLVSVPNATHSILGNYGDCVTAVTSQFLAAPEQPVDASCAAQLRVPWVMPADPLPGGEAR